MRTKRETITSFWIFFISICCLKINGEFNVFIRFIYKTEVRVPILLFSQLYAITDTISKREKMRKETKLENLRNYFRVRRNGINIFKNINKTAYSPFSIGLNFKT